MKFMLMLALCNYTICTPSFEWPYKFDSYYECAITGYNASILRMQELGQEYVEKNRTTILFSCSEVATI